MRGQLRIKELTAHGDALCTGLAGQVADYDKYYDMNIVVVGSTHAIHIREHVPDHWGVISVEYEGDALDSNGTLTINGGTIIALSHPGSDAGLDSENGTYINGGTVIATGDMYDEIKSDSKHSFMGLSFSDRIVTDDVITLTDSSDNVIFSYKTDRTYSNLVYSSSKLVDGDYSLYKNGTVVGTLVNGFYSTVDSFSDGIILGYTGTSMGGMMPGNGGNMSGDKPDMGDVPTRPDDSNRPERPDNQNGEVPEKPDSDMQGMTPPEGNGQSDFTGFESANKVFSISGISNLFSGIITYSVE